MNLRSSHFAGELRRELCARNAVFAADKRLTHVPSYGEMPVTVYAPETDGLRHGNFYAASYRAILKAEGMGAASGQSPCSGPHFTAAS
jgi:hypothetical protein